MCDMEIEEDSTRKVSIENEETGAGLIVSEDDEVGLETVEIEGALKGLALIAQGIPEDEEPINTKELGDSSLASDSDDFGCITLENEEAELNSFDRDEWKGQDKHIFILSESGKPVYSRHGNEDKLVTLFGLMQALVSVAQADGDMIRAIRIGKVLIVFLHKSPLILVAVSRLDEATPQIQIQLTYLYNQVVSILTSKQLHQIYEKRRNYDLRRLLAGSERLLTTLANSLEDDPSFLLAAVKCLPLANGVRETISQTIVQYTTKLKDVVFAILIAENQLVTLVRMRKCFMHPMDLHILLNLIHASESLKTGESWTPICLPRFDSSGFVHAHVSYLTDDCEACLILLTVDRDSFFVLSEAKQKIVERLRRQNCLDALNNAMKTNWPTMDSIGIPQIRHFIYKSRPIAQFTMPRLPLPYASETEGKNELRRLFCGYSKLQGRIHAHSRPLRLLYWTGDKENLMGWMTSTFELYVTFDPLTKKYVAIEGVEKLLKWVRKEEEKLFIIESSTF